MDSVNEERLKMSQPVKREWIGSGVKYEDLFGYARAVRVGNRILVSGTVAAGPEGVVAPGDATAQARYIVDKIQNAIEQLGGELEDVVRTRIYLRNVADWEKVAPVHGERFRDIRPANTLVQAELVGGDFLLEMEAEAEIGSGTAQKGQKA